MQTDREKEIQIDRQREIETETHRKIETAMCPCHGGLYQYTAVPVVAQARPDLHV